MSGRMRQWEKTWRMPGAPESLYDWWVDPTNQPDDREGIKSNRLREFKREEHYEDNDLRINASWLERSDVHIEMMTYRRRERWRLASTVEKTRQRIGTNGPIDRLTQFVELQFTGGPNETIVTLRGIDRAECMRGLESALYSWWHRIQMIRLVDRRLKDFIAEPL